MNVADVMTRDVVTVAADASLKETARIMLENKLSGLPVVDDSGRLLGIVSESDFVMKEAGVPRRRLLDVLFGRGDDALQSAESAGELMSTEIVTVEADATLRMAARLMVKEEVKRMPVVSDGTLVGIVSRADVMRAFARADAEITAEIDGLLERRLLPVPPGAVTPLVEDGRVTLTGTVEAKSDADVLVDLVRRIDGVISKVNELEWDVDDRVSEERFPGYKQEGAARFYR